MTNTPGSGWPGSPPPQGPGSNPGWGAQPWNGGQPQQYPAGGQAFPGQTPAGQAGQYPGQGGQYPGQAGQYPGQPEQPAASTGFDPHRALGEAPPARVSINEFRPPPNRTPLLITIAGLITLVLVIAGGIYVRSLPEQQPSASPTPSQTSAGPGQPFETSDGRKGRWEIMESTWTDEGLQLQVRVYADDDNITFSFLAFANATTEVVAPSHSPESPDIRVGTATKTQPVTGFVFFPMPRGDATIILANGAGRQMSALAVKG